jgi:hypothetical protein
MQGKFGWRLPSYYRFQVLITFGIFVVVSASLGGAGYARQSLSFALLWTAILIWNGYWFLLRIVYQVEVGAGVLSWRAPLRSGQVPVTEVVAIRPSSLAGHIVQTRRGKIVVAFSTMGFDEFGAALRALEPSISVRVGWLRPPRPGLPGRWSGGSGFYRSDATAAPEGE